MDWAAIKRAGFKGAAFDKDNTLTLPFLEQVCVHDVCSVVIMHCWTADVQRAVIQTRGQ